jgi:hypothetical protein
VACWRGERGERGERGVVAWRGVGGARLASEAAHGDSGGGRRTSTSTAAVKPGGDSPRSPRTTSLWCTSRTPASATAARSAPIIHSAAWGATVHGIHTARPRLVRARPCPPRPKEPCAVGTYNTEAPGPTCQHSRPPAQPRHRSPHSPSRRDHRPPASASRANGATAPLAAAVERDARQLGAAGVRATPGSLRRASDQTCLRARCPG